MLNFAIANEIRGTRSSGAYDNVLGVCFFEVFLVLRILILPFLLKLVDQLLPIACVLRIIRLHSGRK